MKGERARSEEKNAWCILCQVEILLGCINECFYGSEDETNSDTSGKTQDGENQSVKKEYVEVQPSAELKNDTSCLDEQTKGPSAVYENKPAEPETERNQASELHNDLSEELIKDAIKKRASHFRANLESISLQEVRRMLEEDLQLEKKTLHSYKSFISKELEEILQSPEIKSANGVKKNLKEVSQKADDGKTRKISKRAHQESDSSTWTYMMHVGFMTDATRWVKRQGEIQLRTRETWI